MPCIPENISVDAATRASLEKFYYGDLTPNSTQAEIMAVYDKIDKDFPADNRITTVEYKDIPESLRRELRLKEGESIQRYKGLMKRATDASAKAWRKGPEGIERALEISSRPDNIVKTEMGTKIHAVLEDLGKTIAATIPKTNIFKHEGPTLTIQEIANAYGLKVEHVKKLSDYMNKLIDRIDKQQKKKDPNAKAKLYFERFVPDFTGNLGLTIDMMVLYSDSTTGHFDFKTIYPYIEDRINKWKNDRLLIESEDWLPDYKMESIIPQLRTGKNTVLNKNLSRRVEQNRAIPIHVQLEFKQRKDQIKHGYFKPDVYYLNVGEDQDPALSMFAVDEMTGIKDLDKKIEVMTNNIHNYQKKIEEFNKNYAERNKWEKRLRAARKFVNKLVVDRDIRTLIDEVQPILRRYYKSFHTLENIHDEYIDGKPNPSYLSNRALGELIAELQSYHGILISSGEFIKQIGAKDDNLKQYQEYQSKVSVLAVSMGDALEMLRREAIDRVMSPEDIEAMQDFSSAGFYQRTFRTLSQQNHPAIARASDLIQQAFNNSRLKRQQLTSEIDGWKIKLDNLSKERGISKVDLYKMLIYDKGREKKTIHSKYTKNFWSAIQIAQENKNSKKLRELLRLKDDAEQLRTKYRDNYIINYNPTQEELKAWDEKHDFHAMMFNKGQYHLYYQENDVESFYTDGYKVLSEKGNETLLEFWNWWQNRMKEFRYLAGVSEYESIPNNFLPWITTDVIDMINQGTLDMAGAREWAESLFKLKAYDQHAGAESVREYVNPATGALLREIPLWYTQPIRDKDGNINHNLKSINLLDSILNFGDAIYTYHHLKNDVEPLIEAIKDVIAIEGEKIQNDYGADKILESGQQARKVGRDTQTYELLDKHLNYHIYGLGIQDVNRRVSKLAGQIKGYQMLKELGFAVLSPAGNFIQIETNAWFEATKGYHFNKQHLRNARKMITGVNSKEDKELAKAWIYYIEPVDGAVSVKSKSLQLNAVRKFFTMDTAMLGYRMAEHNTENEVLLSIIQNYGIDDSGNIKRIKNLPVGTKSLLERSSIKDGKFHVDGLMDSEGNVNIELYTKLRNLSIGVSRGVKGGKRSQDEVSVNYGLLGNLFMGFKSWMPGMVDERASPIRYAKDTGAIVEGKYTAWLTDIGLSKAYSDSERTMGGLIAEVILPSTMRLLLDIATFSWLFKEGGPVSYKVNEQRARVLFDNFKAKYPNSKEIQAMSFEDFLDYKQGQIRSLAAELFIILSLFSFVYYMAGEDDDGERRFRKTWASRNAFRLVNRAKRELSFFVNYNDLRGSVLRQPIPQLGILDDLRKWSINTRDEMGDFIYGEEEERGSFGKIAFGANRGWRQDKPAFYETQRLVPGNKFWQMFEVFERDQERQY